MRDSTVAGDAPPGADLYADYVDIPASHDPRAAFHISRVGSGNEGDCLDVGEGVANIQAPGWTARRRVSGLAQPWCYTNYANWTALRAEFGRQGVAPPHWWIAWYTRDEPTIARVFSEGAQAVQWANAAMTGGHYDESRVADGAPIGGTEMNANENAAVLKMAYALGGHPFADIASDPLNGEFNTHLNALNGGTQDLHTVVNEVQQAHPWTGGQAPPAGTPGTVVVSGLNLKVTGP